MSITSLSAQQLRAAADLKEQIEGLQTELNTILGGEVLAAMTIEAAVVPATPQTPKKKKVSEALLQALAKARAARAAKLKAAKGTTPVKPKQQFNPALSNTRSEAAKAMWARRRKAAKAKKLDDDVPF